jgi:hypothetical protein
VQRRAAASNRHDVYAFMRVAYPGVFLAMIGEGLFHPEPQLSILALGATLLLGGKLLKWWAISTLGPPGPSGDRGARRIAGHPRTVSVSSSSELPGRHRRTGWCRIAGWRTRRQAARYLLFVA